MIFVLLRFLFCMIVSMNWTWTKACHTASKIFQIKEEHVMKMGNNYIAGDVAMPSELPTKPRGRASEAFKNNHGDNFCKLKEEHLKAIVEYVTDRNKYFKGVCSVKAIIAHLYSKFDIEFNYQVVHYALKSRLGLKYRTPLKSRLVFTEGRNKLGVQFCLSLDQALKEQAAGTAVLVYMDETYCHTNHMPSKCWCGDGVGRVERSRSKVITLTLTLVCVCVCVCTCVCVHVHVHVRQLTRLTPHTHLSHQGTLTIILHAMTKDGWLVQRNADGVVPAPQEFQSGEVLTCEMVFRGKIGAGDYHDNMNGAMFDKWLTERLFPTFRSVYPGKKMILMMDNAPYHHCFSDDCFFAKDKNKDEIAAKIREFDLAELTVHPFAEETVVWKETPAADVRAAEYAGWVLYDKGDGAMWLVDGLTDEGYGEAIVYTRICGRKFGAVESTLVGDFQRLVNDGEYVLVGHGEHAVRFCRQSGIMNARNVVPRQRRNTRRVQRECKSFFDAVQATTYTYNVEDIGKKYNGGGGKGTGGPKGAWLAHAVDEYIKLHHPHLRETKVM